MKIIKKQNGAVLIIAMLMLTVLSIIVISASSTTVIQQKMTTNLYVKELARQSAELTLQQAEIALLSISTSALNQRFENTSGYYFYDKNRQLSKPNNWNNLQALTSNVSLKGIKPPVYIIERMPAIKTIGNSLAFNQPLSSTYYRITVMAQGSTKSAINILQSIVKK